MKKLILFLSLLLFSTSTWALYHWVLKPPSVHEAAEPKSDRPEYFEEYFHAIRTADGDTDPRYRMNYKLEELSLAMMQLPAYGKRSTVLDWVERGPGNVSGRTRGLVVDASDASGKTWFIGTAGGGIWRTQDEGRSWQNMTPSLPNLSTSVIIQDPQNPDLFYAGTGEGYSNVDAIGGDGIFVSKDHGKTWTQLPSTAGTSAFRYVNRLVIHPKNSQILIAATGEGLFKTSDGGATWQKKFTGNMLQVLPNPLNFKVLYAVQRNTAVLKSTDYGETWKVLNLNAPSRIGRVELAVTASDTSRVYGGAVTYRKNDQGTEEVTATLLVSRNSGLEWAPAKEVAGLETNFYGGQGWYDNALAVAPNDVNTLVIGGIDIIELKLSDSNTYTTKHLTRAYSNCANYYGSICNGTPNTAIHPDQHNFVLIPSASSYKILNANDGGLAFSPDAGSTWDQIVGFPTTQFYGATKQPGAAKYFGGTQDNGTWISQVNTTLAEPWTRPLGGDGFKVIWHAADPKQLIGTVYNNNINKSIDGGSTFSNVSATIDNTDATAPFITRFGYAAVAPDLVFTLGKSGLWRSEDFASTWTNIKPGDKWVYDAYGTHVEVSNTNPKIVWTGNGITESRQPYVSKDGGLSFEPTGVYSGTAKLGPLTNLITHPTEDSTAYALFSFSSQPKIVRTRNLGKTWEDLTGFEGSPDGKSTNGFPNVSVYNMLVMPHNPNMLWAGTEIGLFESTDNGKSWHYADNGLPAVAIWDMEIVDDEVVLGTHGRGIWSVRIPEILNAALMPAIISNFSQPFSSAPRIDLKLRSAYDSTIVWANGNRIQKIAANQVNETVSVELTVEATSIEVQVTTYKRKVAMISKASKSGLQPFRVARNGYASDFEAAAYLKDFYNPSPPASADDAQLTIGTAEGFSGKGLHSSHPYSIEAGTNLMYQLAIPIVVANDAANAYIRFDEVAVIKPGTVASARYPDLAFGSFVVIEASKDGVNWKVLGTGLNARSYPEWLTLYQQKKSATPSNYKKREVNLQPSFKGGDKVLIRFRLSASAQKSDGWGWAVDNLEVQQAVPVPTDSEAQPLAFNLHQNYPNPFNPSTQLAYTLAQPQQVSLEVFDLAGRRIRTLVNGVQSAGAHQVTFDGTGLPSGMYVYRLQAGRAVQTRKMLLVK